MDGLVVPRIRLTEEVESAVQLTKYPPLGCRGISITRAHSDYAVGDWGEYMEMRNKRFLLFVQIETLSALDQLGSIAGVRGLDGMILGPGDLSVELGIPGEVRHAEAYRPREAWTNLREYADDRGPDLFRLGAAAPRRGQRLPDAELEQRTRHDRSERKGRGRGDSLLGQWLGGCQRTVNRSEATRVVSGAGVQKRERSFTNMAPDFRGA